MLGYFLIFLGDFFDLFFFLGLPTRDDGLSKGTVCKIINPETEWLLCNASLIIWDEVVMAPRENVEIVDRTMRVLRKNQALPLAFGR